MIAVDFGLSNLMGAKAPYFGARGSIKKRLTQERLLRQKSAILGALLSDQVKLAEVQTHSPNVALSWAQGVLHNSNTRGETGFYYEQRLYPIGTTGQVAPVRTLILTTAKGKKMAFCLDPRQEGGRGFFTQKQAGPVPEKTLTPSPVAQSDVTGQVLAKLCGVFSKLEVILGFDSFFKS
jgi:hypothetical protein